MAAAAWASWHKALRGAVGFVRGVSCFYVVYNYGGFLSKVDGPSMFPTFTGRGDWVVAEALPGLSDRVQVGDVVISTRPIQADENIIKRVTAVQGQTVNVDKAGSIAPVQIQVPPGHVWLQGDNLILSRDSREYGPVPLALVKGRVVAQLWPSIKWVERKFK
uniref:Peptidase S26 domain-containing protein n=1 Tax=Tetradesmus obliquus TaxID=3088 RepID=A0A383VE91_TETOB|eukprot:jgi/Sobl393_1/17034/SZX62696.1